MVSDLEGILSAEVTTSILRRKKKEQFLSVVAPPTFFPNDWIKRLSKPLSLEIEEK